MITLREIAETCGVSVATVSNILNGKPKVSEATRQKVLQVVRENDYQPNYLAQSMRKKKTMTIGIITEDLKEFSATPIVESIMAVCEENNYRTLLINLRMYDKWQDTWYEDREKLESVVVPALHEMQALMVDGVIYVAGHCRIIDYIPENYPIPILIAYALSKDRKYTSVIIDDERGSYNMTKYLIDLGHKKIGVVAGREDNYHTQHRLLGYQKALEDAGIPYDLRLISYGKWDKDSGYLATEKLMEQKPTGIFCMNDFMAAGTYNYLFSHHIEVGKDISVVGYDNQTISGYMQPMLTTNDINLLELGKMSASLLIEELREESIQGEKKIITIESDMIIRDSASKK